MIGEAAEDFGAASGALPAFFKHCFTARVRQYLCAAREVLRWRTDQVDRTLMALLLVYLHGKREASLSNQMRQAKSMAPDYAVRWWQERGLEPPDVEPVDFLVKRLAWRYAKGRPTLTGSKVYLGDSVRLLPEIKHRIQTGRLQRPKLLLTSPPYYAVTNYHYDQWLRLWLLGGQPNALRVPNAGEYRDRFDNLEKYRGLLLKVFGSAAEVLSRNAIVYVRTGRGEETYDATVAALRAAFPRKRIRVTRRPFLRPTQTRLFGDKSVKEGEVDIVMRPR